MKTAKELKKFKGQMKRNMTPSESLLNAFLLHKYQKDYKPQVILGFFILDFVIVSKLLVVEVDGDSHKKTKSYDDFRTRFVNECGLKVVRFTNMEVSNEVISVMEKINSYPDEADFIKRFRSALGKANSLKSKVLLKNQ